jgi:energy-coupling factor transporter transmembrane protein EcfT
MKGNKKSEGTASSFLIASIVGITMIIAIGVYVNGFFSSYSQTEIPYFSEYNDVKNNITLVSNDYVTGYDSNSTGEGIGFEDNLFVKAFKVVKGLPKLQDSLNIGLKKLGNDLHIPAVFIGLLITILIITLITLVIKIFRGFNDV